MLAANNAAQSAQAQQQALLVQQIVNQQVALFQSAGQTLTPEMLTLIQQNASVIVAQQFAVLEAQQAAALQAQQAAALQAQQAATLQAQQVAALQAQQAAALQAQQAAALQAQQTTLLQTRQTPVATTGTGNYVLNRNSKKFHYSYCSSVGDMSAKNKIFSSQSRNEIIAQGYVPCKRCNP